MITEEGLTRYAAAAYRAYRKERTSAPLAHLGRLLRDTLLPLRDEILGFPPYDKNTSVTVAEMRFLGLCDTVDAYGLPIRELKSAVDRYIWLNGQYFCFSCQEAGACLCRCDRDDEEEGDKLLATKSPAV